MFSRTDLEKKLRHCRDQEISEQELLKTVEKILSASESPTERRIRSKMPAMGNRFNFDLLESSHLYHISQIKKICIHYRLRFLSAHLLKEKLPVEVLLKVEELEKKHRTRFVDFRIMAPAAFFKLENADDPMLFVPIGNDYFYLIHKWGRDLHPLRRLQMWPLKTLETLMISSLFFGFFATFLVQKIFFASYDQTSQFLILFLYTFKAVVLLVFFFGISKGKNVSSSNWNSKFFNS